MDFNLGNSEGNKEFILRHSCEIVQTIESTSDYEIVRTGDGNNGWIYLHNINLDTVDYAIKYQTRNRNWMRRTVTQCVLWRSPSSPYVQGITKRIFFDYLVVNYHTIMSDGLQTSSGHDFWLARMTNAVSYGLRVGVAYLNPRIIKWYNPITDGNYQKWITGQDTFGSRRKHGDTKYQSIRYVIEQNQDPITGSVLVQAKSP